MSAALVSIRFLSQVPLVGLTEDYLVRYSSLSVSDYRMCTIVVAYLKM